MAKISDETLNLVFDLQRQLLRIIDEGEYVSWQILNNFGETAETIIELEELDNIREKSRNGFSRLNNSILLISQYQPVAPDAATTQLKTIISQITNSIPVLKASIKEIERNWNLS